MKSKLLSIFLFSALSAYAQLDWDDWDTDQVDMGHRYGHSMVYDSSRNVIVLFGGIDEDRNFLGDTWEWDGENWVNVASDGPGIRAYHDMVFDSARNACVIYGGVFVENVISGSETVYSDTWEWRGVKWVKIVDMIHPRPNARSRYGLAFDSSNNLVWMWDGLGDCRCRFNFYMWTFGPRFMILR